MSKLLIKLVRLYQRTPVSSHSSCKFIPSCSDYMIGCLEEFGFFKGTFLGIKRLLRCNPFNKGGLDPVPKKHE